MMALSQRIYRPSTTPPGIVFRIHAEELFHSSTPVPNLYPFSFLPAFPLGISSFPLVDTLQEFIGARVMLNFIKLIRITLKTSLSRLQANCFKS